jgi:hypothetical protein
MHYAEICTVVNITIKVSEAADIGVDTETIRNSGFMITKKSSTNLIRVGLVVIVVLIACELFFLS